MLRPLLATLLLGPALTALPAQEAFKDPDFDFTMTLPAGMTLLAPEQLAAARGMSVEELNTSRADSEDGKAFHTYVWLDGTSRDREVHLYVADGDLPFGHPDQFQSAVTSGGVEVDDTQMLEPPDFPPGMRTEGVRTKSNGSVVRQTDVFLPMGRDPGKYATLRALCLEGDWDLMWPDFEAMIRSVRYPQPRQAGGGGGRGGRRGGGGGGGRAGGATEEESWDELEVTGSLALAAVLLMGLFVGGRS